MSALGMHQAMQQSAVNICPYTYSRTNGDIERILTPLGCAEAYLAKHCSIDICIKCICKGIGNKNSRIYIITLSDIKKPWKSGDCAEIKLIETIFAACKSENHAVIRNHSGKISKITSARSCAITATNQEKVSYLF